MLLAKLWLNRRRFAKKNNHDANSAAAASARRASNISAIQKEKKYDKMNKIVILITILFILFTLPVSFSQIYFVDLFFKDWGLFLIYLFDCFSFSYHGMNFFIIYFSNNVFKKEVRVFLRIEKEQQNNNNSASTAGRRTTLSNIRNIN
jgi:hypothetical protein